MSADGGGEINGARGEFAALLGEFRRTAVLVPLADGDDLWAAESEGIRWIHAFTDEGALARWATARGEADQEWMYRRILGARLLDVVIPAVGSPCGVAVDVADGPDAVLFPPVAGIVPEPVAVDAEASGDAA
ncbi:SseB family protein [Streptomyces meridianus]|uniref:SseB family protein n=1 Tax=Streptomyces meridianus TaxID=2938945 RepID=A0ABT0X867_9ACTN|nr:SseB family protein [Streptomyces meridianus]MCM2578722.1 SseB family protein [Streptomyces meridianus]